MLYINKRYCCNSYRTCFIQTHPDQPSKCGKWHIQPSVHAGVRADAHYSFGSKTDPFLALVWYATSGFALPMPTNM